VDYGKLGLLRKLFPQVPMLLVTATATPHVIRVRWRLALGYTVWRPTD